MDSGTIITALTGVAGVIGGLVGGKKLGSGRAVSTAVEVVELLRIQVDTLTEQGKAKDREICDLRARVDTLESLVTQRAEVEVVQAQVQGVRGVVNRIADKVGA